MWENETDKWAPWASPVSTVRPGPPITLPLCSDSPASQLPTELLPCPSCCIISLSVIVGRDWQTGRRTTANPHVITSKAPERQAQQAGHLLEKGSAPRARQEWQDGGLPWQAQPGAWLVPMDSSEWVYQAALNIITSFSSKTVARLATFHQCPHAHRHLSLASGYWGCMKTFRAYCSVISSPTQTLCLAVWLEKKTTWLGDCVTVMRHSHTGKFICALNELSTMWPKADWTVWVHRIHKPVKMLMMAPREGGGEDDKKRQAFWTDILCLCFQIGSVQLEDWDPSLII